MLLRCESLEPPMSQSGQTEKVSQRAFLDRCTPESGRGFDRGERQLRAKSGHSEMTPKSTSLNHLVGTKEDRVRNFKPHRLCSFHVEHKLELRCLVHG